MATNFGYVGTGAGVVKLIHLLFGIITVGCAAASFDDDNFQDRFFVGGVITIFLLSIIYLIVHLLSDGVARSPANRGLNVFYHLLGALLLIVGAGLFLHKSVQNNNRYCKNLPPGFGSNRDKDICGAFATKAAAGAFAILNGFLYIVAIVLTAIGSGFDDDDDPEIEGYNK